jgi:hypothetical protein
LCLALGLSWTRSRPAALVSRRLDFGIFARDGHFHCRCCCSGLPRERWHSTRLLAPATWSESLFPSAWACLIVVCELVLSVATGIGFRVVRSRSVARSFTAIGCWGFLPLSSLVGRLHFGSSAALPIGFLAALAPGRVDFLPARRLFSLSWFA